MIIIEIKGGLGNQMFQYAAGLSLAHASNQNLMLDKNWFSTQSNRIYRLDKFSIQAQYLSVLQYLRIPTDYDGRHLRKIKAGISKIFRLKNPTIIREENNPDLSLMIEPQQDYFLSGYWQSERFFKEIKEDVKSAFDLKEKTLIEKKQADLLHRMDSENSVAIHIRRGDYLKQEDLSVQFLVLGVDYYINSVTRLAEMENELQFFIFTDDPVWATTHFDIGYPYIIVSDKMTPDYEELYLMSRCKHQIIANSSFSWWGAWLNSYPEKRVFAPQNWVLDGEQNSRKMGNLPENWIVL